ncbi:class I SAM-dependent methyltransferase [Halosimplex sp. J119]
MFSYFNAVADGGVSFHAIEPDPYMRRQAIEKADELGLEIELRSAGAESLPYEDDSFDVVIASVVFCTNPDIEAPCRRWPVCCGPAASSASSSTYWTTGGALASNLLSHRSGSGSPVGVI